MTLIGQIIYKWLFSIAMLVYQRVSYPIGSVYGIYANIWGILMINVTIYSIHGSYGYLYTFQLHQRLCGFDRLSTFASFPAFQTQLLHYRMPRRCDC